MRSTLIKREIDSYFIYQLCTNSIKFIFNNQKLTSEEKKLHDNDTNKSFIFSFRNNNFIKAIEHDDEQNSNFIFQHYFEEPIIKNKIKKVVKKTKSIVV